MDSILLQSVVGIVTGIFTTAILFLIKDIWTKKVIPFLRATRYQGVILEGKWYGASENEDPEKGEVYWNEATLFLEQNAHDLNGLFIYKFKNHEKDFHLEFDVKGYLWEGYLTLNFMPKDKRITSYATTLLKLHSGGCLLIGEWLFRSVDEEKVMHTPLSLGRDLKANN